MVVRPAARFASCRTFDGDGQVETQRPSASALTADSLRAELRGMAVDVVAADAKVLRDRASVDELAGGGDAGGQERDDTAGDALDELVHREFRAPERGRRARRLHPVGGAAHRLAPTGYLGTGRYLHSRVKS